MALEPVSDEVFVPLPLIRVCVCIHVHACTHKLLLHKGTQDPASTVVFRGPESRRLPIF